MNQIYMLGFLERKYSILDYASGSNYLTSLITNCF